MKGLTDLGESLLKKQKLRNDEYYNMQDIKDKLFKQSLKGYKFNNLMQIIMSKQNILLAYRNIKSNLGSRTPGTDKLDINYINKMNQEIFVTRIQNKLLNYQPKSIRRVEIPKPNGKTRPLGIPCIEDRIIQQCIKQILEPICEAKFHNHSYGFRPNRSASHAISRCNYLMWKVKLHYVVDIDIKGFFDNVNHSKLKKQIWSLGIRDKNLIKILDKILKSEIQGVGIPTKGTPQGGIISPLLSNIVLNELDWWISSQWETFETKYHYGSNSHKFRAMKTTKLKEVWLVRYADDFKIFCRDYKTAQKIFNATRKWLKERLDLDISHEKSRVTNLRKNYTEFLGFKLKVKKKNNKIVSTSKMSEKAVKMTIKNLKKQIKVIQKNPVDNQVIRLNAMILGSHNYYRNATCVSADFAKIDFMVTQILDSRLRSNLSRKQLFTKTYERLYGTYNGKIRTVCKTTIFPIYGCTYVSPTNFNQNICNYTMEGRKIIHDNMKGYHQHLIYYLYNHSDKRESTELTDNKISLMCGQKGLCHVTKKYLEVGSMECHHKIPKYLGGTDKYDNLVWISSDVHKLIHATKLETVEKYLNILNLSDKEINKINSLRKLVGNSVI